MTHELTTLPNLRRLWTYVKTTANGVDGSYETARVNERVGIPRIEFFFGFFTLVKNFPKTWGFFMFCHLLDRSFDWVDSCMFRTILESVMVLRTRSWWGKKNEEKPRIQQRFFFLCTLRTLRKSQPSTPPEDVPFFGGVDLHWICGKQNILLRCQQGSIPVGECIAKACQLRSGRLRSGWASKGGSQNTSRGGFCLVIWATINNITL